MNTSNRPTDPVAVWTLELADKLLHCAREFDRFAMRDEQRTCAEASRLIREGALERDIQAQQEASYGASKEFGW